MASSPADRASADRVNVQISRTTMSGRREEHKKRHVIAPRAATEVQNGVEQLVGEALGFFGGAGREDLCDEVAGQLAGRRVAHVCQAVRVEDEDVARGQRQML